MSMIFQSYAVWPHMTVRAERRLRPEDEVDAAAGTRSAHRCAARGDASSRAQAERYPVRALRRPAAARRARAGAGAEARHPAARRAAVEPRRQPARRHALRDPPPARRVPLHVDLRHARPGRGDDHGRPHRGHERRAHRADRHAGGRLRASATRAFVARFIGGEQRASMRRTCRRRTVEVARPRARHRPGRVRRARRADELLREDARCRACWPTSAPTATTRSRASCAARRISAVIATTSSMSGRRS